MPRNDLVLTDWSIPDPYPTPSPWSEAGKCPGKFRWNREKTLLRYSHLIKASTLKREWRRCDFESPSAAERVASEEIEKQCRAENLMDNQYRNLSDDVLELVVGDRTTIISLSLIDKLFEYHWRLKKVRTSFYVITTINKDRVLLARYLLKAPAGATVLHLDHNPLNHTRKNLLLKDGDQGHALPLPAPVFNTTPLLPTTVFTTKIPAPVRPKPFLGNPMLAPEDPRWRSRPPSAPRARTSWSQLRERESLPIIKNQPEMVDMVLRPDREPLPWIIDLNASVLGERHFSK
jgi:hypothetical protein